MNLEHGNMRKYRAHGRRMLSLRYSMVVVVGMYTLVLDWPGVSIPALWGSVLVFLSLSFLTSKMRMC
jgi:hypothetical protein